MRNNTRSGPPIAKLPLGWRLAEKQGLKQECLDYIKEVWTDMRPLSLRNKAEASHPMEEMRQQDEG